MNPSHTKASDTFCKSLESFLATAVDDMQKSKHRYDMARRTLNAAEDTLLRSRSAVLDPARRALLQV